MRAVTKREFGRGVPAQAFSGLEFSLERRRPKCRDRRRLRLSEQGEKDCHHARADPGSHGFPGPKKAGREPGLAGTGGVAAQYVEQVVLGHPVIDLVGDSQRFLVQRLRRSEITGEQRSGALVREHHLEAVEVTRLSAETRALCGGGPYLVEIALE